jgi:hypothetical protein
VGIGRIGQRLRVADHTGVEDNLGVSQAARMPKKNKVQ